MKAEKIKLNMVVRLKGGGRLAQISGRPDSGAQSVLIQYPGGSEYPMLVSRIQREATPEEAMNFEAQDTSRRAEKDRLKNASGMEQDHLLAEYRTKLVLFARAAAAKRDADAELEKARDELAPLARAVDYRDLRNVGDDLIIAEHDGTFAIRRHLDAT